MPPNGNFFKFVEELQKQDQSKDMDFVLLVQGNDRVFSPKRKKLERRNAKIRKCQLKLNNGRLSVEEFLNELAYPNNRTLLGMADPGHVILGGPDVLEEELQEGVEEVVVPVIDEAVVPVPDNADERCQQLQDQVEILRQQLLQEQGFSLRMMCVVCLVNVRRRCLLPCRHLVVCEGCSLGLLERYVESYIQPNVLFLCPVCRGEVTEIQAQFL